MKKRLRKKLHLGEFREFGFALSFDLPNSLKAEDQWRQIEHLLEFLESHGLQMGGGGQCHWEAFVTRNARGSVDEEARERVRAWLVEQGTVENLQVGPLVDAWHGW